jgi:hypothetical protein
VPYTTVVAGTVITASWGNMIRDQVITPFTDAATRTAQVTVPVEGMVSYLADSKRLELYNGTRYVPAGWQRVGGSVPRTSDVTMTTTETLADSATVTCVAGRRYRITWSGSYNSSAAGDSIDIRLRYAAGGSVTNTDTLIKACPLAEPAANHNLSGAFTAEITGIAAGQTTFGVFGVRIAGSGTVHLYAAAIYPVTFVIDDVGPA